MLCLLLGGCTSRRTIFLTSTVTYSRHDVGRGPGCAGGIMTPALSIMHSYDNFRALPSCSFRAVPGSCTTLMLVNNFN